MTRKENKTMTLFESLQDIGKGRFIDNGCDYELIALAKGLYCFTLASGEMIEIRLDGKQGENAAKIEKEYYSKAPAIYRKQIIKAEYKKGGAKYGSV